jgi:hypothetical protein
MTATPEAPINARLALRDGFSTVSTGISIPSPVGAFLLPIGLAMLKSSDCGAGEELVAIRKTLTVKPVKSFPGEIGNAA